MITNEELARIDGGAMRLKGQDEDRVYVYHNVQGMWASGTTSIQRLRQSPNLALMSRPRVPHVRGPQLAGDGMPRGRVAHHQAPFRRWGYHRRDHLLPLGSVLVGSVLPFSDGLLRVLQNARLIDRTAADSWIVCKKCGTMLRPRHCDVVHAQQTEALEANLQKKQAQITAV